MGTIRILPEHVVNKIAAGEVIERPGSVVKELVENALDARATMITIDIRHGGKSLIKVVDNGVGMDRDDAELCLTTHATSKIRELEDIVTITSLGFRGEALSSIAAVSRVTVRTRHSSHPLGTEVRSVGGEIELLKEVGMAPGTSMEVADLFFNTPARKKFLKGERAECGRIAEWITTISLAYPQVGFKLFRDGVLVYDYLPCSHLKDRLLATHYREWMSYLIPLEVKSPEFTATGYVATTELSWGNRSAQLFYINKRPVRNGVLSHAVQSAYQGLLPQGRFPVGIIFFEMDPAKVDVNIHPTKREVKLLHEREIHNILAHQVRELVRKQERPPRAFPSYTLRGEKTCDPVGIASTQGFAGIQKVEGNYEEKYEEFSHARVNFFGPPQMICEENGGGYYGEGKKLRIISPLGQIKGSYVIAETDEGFIIVDQHAAHERIVFEHILNSLKKGETVAQGLLQPVTFELSFKHARLLEEYLVILTQIGFSITCLGGNTFSIDAIPASLGTIDVKRFIQSFLDEAGEGKRDDPLMSKKEAVAKILACKSQAIKAHKKMSSEEMEYLLKSLQNTTQPFKCPHGRPTVIEFTLEDLRKQFKRR